MTRRIALAAITGAVFATLVADTASAFTRREAICVRGARSRSRQTIADARKAATEKLQTDLQACLNDNTGCVGTCLAEQAACQKLQTGVGTAYEQCRDACRIQVAVDTDACRDSAQDPVACVSAAQYKLFTCNQDCQANVQAGLIECNGQFNDCLQGCSNP